MSYNQYDTIMNRISLPAGLLTCLLSACFIASCQSPDDHASIQQEATSGSRQTLGERAYPGETGVRKNGVLFGQEISFEEINGQQVYQGDIILSSGQSNGEPGKGSRTAATPVYGSAKRWPGATVFYTISTGVTNKAPILDAIAEIEAKTAVRFIARTLQTNYVTFGGGRGPSSSIGMIGGQQFINVGLFPAKGAILHEIGHTLGLLHEHTRVDRDKTIKLKYANVDANALSDFGTYASQGVPALDFQAFDIGSIMMVDAYTSSSNGQPTITLLNDLPYAIQRTGLSAKDADCINAMYSSLYVIQSGKLYGTDRNQPRNVLIADMVIKANAVTSDQNYVYVAKERTLMRYHKITGASRELGSNYELIDFLTMYDGSIYAVQWGYLFRINPGNGMATQVGPRKWFGASAMTEINGNLIIVNGNSIYRVSPQSGISTVLNAYEFSGCGHLIACNGKLWVLYGPKIYSIDPATGVSSVLPAYKMWEADSRLAAISNQLYVLHRGVLSRISQSSGELTTISTGWADGANMTGDDATN